MQPRLGVNIDHVATLRQARGEDYPSVKRAAEEVIKSGANQITIHLREDRRYIQEKDLESVKEITQKYNVPFNLEIACGHEMLGMTKKFRPEWVCIVPEKREERTTEGGLGLNNPETLKRVRIACAELKKEVPGTKISLFLETNKEILDLAKDLPIDAVEIHTGEYAKLFIEGKDYLAYLATFNNSQNFLKQNNIACHAGHGLTLESVVPLLNEGCFEEYNIGHWIIADSVFRGLSQVVRDFSKLFERHSVKKI
jgi:pyridoxine 5-phosphate synthase